MTKKRFTYRFYDGLNVDILDNNEPVATMSAGDGETVTELLNRMNDEKEQLKDEVVTLRRTERSWRKIHCCNKESDNCGIVSNQESKIKLLEKENEDLREVNKENQRLHEENVKQCERWKTLYEIKDKEVTARVKRLNEICNRYKYAITFDKDIDPNDAVNILCDRILQTEVEM